jgi:alcohol dehydrogenase (cytochrome c)
VLSHELKDAAREAQVPLPVVPITSAPRVSVVPQRPRYGGKVKYLLALIVVLGGVLATVIPPLRWRVQVVFLDLAGRIPDLEFSELPSLLMPGAKQPQISRLVATKNPYAVIHVPSATPADVAAGAQLFREQCADCHSPDGSGGPGAPALFGREFKHGDTEWAVYRTIRDGVPNTGMPPHPLKRAQLWQLVAYIQSLGVRADSSATSTAVTARMNKIQVPYAELARTAEPGADWLTYAGAYGSNRHSTLAQINSHNVGSLAVRWVHQLVGGHDKIESTPIVRDGIMYFTVPPARVLAIDAATGRQIWEHDHPYEFKGGGEGPLEQNRGVAVLDDRVFVGTWDSKLTALSAATGKVLWEVSVGEYPGTYISGAPLVYRDLVVTGVGSPPGFGRGFIAAYDVKTGKERWRFVTIPGPGEHGNETWSGDSWRKGGAGTWLTGSYDPQSDLLYWGIGNPRPDFDRKSRQGDNLYSDSVVALRGMTGRVVWQFQFTPGDDHDWDSNQTPLIADRSTVQGPEKRLLWANRNGFYYVFDRESGAFLRGVPFARQNWAAGLNSAGRPILATPNGGSLQGTPVYPGAKGATNWWPPSYDPTLGLVFVPVLEQGMIFFPSAHTLPSTAGRSFYTAVRALDATTGKLLWEHRQEARSDDSNTAGLLSTRGAVLFGADHGTFFALDSRSGQLLWSVETGGSTYAAPVTYAVAGEQFVSVIAGRSLMTFALPKAVTAKTEPGASAEEEGPAASH